MRAATLDIHDLTVGYGGAPVLDGFELEVNAGEFVALLGPSGCGKSTALKAIAGLLTPRSGHVNIGDQVMNSVPTERRGIAMVFQKPLLFPHLTVAENVAFGLTMQHVPLSERTRRVAEALELLRLEGLERRLPREISGGQEQRVALARAIVTEPRVLLLDEPFSALDEQLRAEMRSLCRGIQRRLGITTLFVTHDQQEAATLADRIALLFARNIEQIGPARDFYTAPRTLRVARFFGWQILAGVRAGETTAGNRGSHISLRAAEHSLAFRPEAAWLEPASDSVNGDLTGVVEEIVDLGIRRRCRIRTSFGPIDVEESVSAETLQLALGETVLACVPPRAVCELPC